MKIARKIKQKRQNGHFKKMRLYEKNTGINEEIVLFLY